jgi:hypothetical protein
MYSSPISIPVGFVGGQVAKKVTTAIVRDGLGVTNPFALALVRIGGAAAGHAVAAGMVNAITLDVAAGITVTPGGAIIHGLHAAAEELSANFVGQLGAAAGASLMAHMAKNIPGIKHPIVPAVAGLVGSFGGRELGSDADLSEVREGVEEGLDALGECLDAAATAIGEFWEGLFG